MNLPILINFIDLFVPIFCTLLVVRVILSYFAKPDWLVWQWLVALTEPLLGPIRGLLPTSPGVDFSPLVTFFLLEGIQALVHHLA